MKPIVVLYHANCQDGFTAAWVARKKFGRKASYIPVQHQLPPPKGLINKEIYLVDYCYSADLMRKLVADNPKVTVIDHHLTNEKAAKTAPNHLWAKNHCGAVLAWRYFYPKKKMPLFLKYVEDMDLWKLNLPSSNEFMAFSESIHYNFKKWEAVIKQFEHSSIRKKIFEKGKILLDYQESLIESMIAKADIVNFQGHKILAVNAPILTSELGNALYKKMPPMGLVWFMSRGLIKVSLRSNGSVNVGKLATKFGGGGLAGAASFKMPVTKKLPWKRIKK